MLKYFLRSVAFLVIFVFIFLGVTPIFVPKNTDPGSGIHDPLSKGFLAEPAHSLDVLFLGNSGAYTSFIPLQLWEEYGITSYLCSSPAQPMYQTYSYLSRFLENQSPKVIILEATCLFQSFTMVDILTHTLEEYLPYIRYHDRWKILQTIDFSGHVDYTYQYSEKGYRFSSIIDPADTSHYMEKTDNAESPTNRNLSYTQKIIDLCKANNIKLILISVPSTINWDYGKHNFLAQKSPTWQVDFIDMNLLPEEVPIDWSSDTYDKGNHLNYSGATKVTAYIGSYLHGLGILPDRRADPAFEHWNLSLEDFYSKTEKQ